MERIRTELFALRDMAYRDFQAALIPTIDRESVIGVRMPVLRRYAKQLRKSEYHGSNVQQRNRPN